jgi:hypothetical protein
MGAFFGSIHVRTGALDAVQKAIEQVAKEADCKFLLGPVVGDWISIFPTSMDKMIKSRLKLQSVFPMMFFI